MSKMNIIEDCGADMVLVEESGKEIKRIKNKEEEETEDGQKDD